MFGDIIRNSAKTIYPRTFVFGDIITSADCDCKQVTEKSPPVRHVVRHVKICLEINFHWNRTRFVFFMIYFVFFSNSKWPPFQDGRQYQNFKSWYINFRWCLIFVQIFIDLRLFVSEKSPGQSSPRRRRRTITSNTVIGCNHKSRPNRPWIVLFHILAIPAW